jgi:hypothetical protein
MRQVTRRLLGIAALALAACGGSNSTPPASSQVTVATPTFSPTAGVYTIAQDVTISCNTAGAAIHYTTDGTAPTASSPTFSSPLPVAVATTIKAIATAAGLNDSAVATAAYSIDAGATPAAAPTFTPTEGNYTAAQSVTMSTVTPGATVYYTLTVAGAMPTTASTHYTTPVLVSATSTLMAIAAGNGHTASTVTSAIYVIGGGGY